MGTREVQAVHRPAIEKVALADCRLLRPRGLEQHVAIVTAGIALRRFPTRVSTSLGICLKTGSAHDVVADGRRLVFPADAISVRPPGCVWSSGRGINGFVSVVIAPEVFAGVGIRGSMTFLPPTALPRFTLLVRALAAADSSLEADEIVTRLVTGVLDSSALAADVPNDGNAGRHAVDRAREFLHTRVEEKPTLEETADAAGVDKFLLLRYFRRTLDTTPHTYLVMLRINRAQELIARGTSLPEAASAAGFSDQAHMGRWFRRLCGITPATYRRALHS